jgi:hypothetical protein
MKLGGARPDSATAKKVTVGRGLVLGREGSVLGALNQAVPIDERPEEGLLPGATGGLGKEELGAHERVIVEFEAGDERAKQKVLKKLATRTPLDGKIDYRQKNGQLRFGDVIALSFQE